MKLDGPSLYALFISAANALDNNKTAINNMNVFPVPDGDTGINMSLTLDAVRKLDDDFAQKNVSDLSKKIASLILRAARGNSGAILSLFFRGMSKAFANCEEADTSDVARAFKKGTEEAYRAVMNPTEGTILTVMRRCSEEAEKAVAEGKFASDDVRGLFSYIVDIGEDALSHTPDQLPILKEVNVVDAGGYGFMTALNGMLAALNNAPVERIDDTDEVAEADFSSFDTESITFPYCTECIVEKYEQFIGEGHAEEFHTLVGKIGDSVVFVEEIGSFAFGSCESLGHISLPKSLLRVYADSFDGCTSLTDIGYGGTVAQWHRIFASHSKEHEGFKTVTVICADGECEVKISV